MTFKNEINGGILMKKTNLIAGVTVTAVAVASIITASALSTYQNSYGVVASNTAGVVNAAESSVFGNAKIFELGKTYTSDFPHKDALYYRITVDSGTYALRVISDSSKSGVALYNSVGEIITAKKITNTYGTVETQNADTHITVNGVTYGKKYGNVLLHSGNNVLDWDKNAQKYEGELTYQLSKGDYYIMFVTDDHSEGYGNVYFKAEKEKVNEIKKEDAVYLTSNKNHEAIFAIPLKVGETLPLSAATANIPDDLKKKAKYYVSDENIAGVNQKGEVKALKEGIAVVKLKIGDVSLRLELVVTK